MAALPATVAGRGTRRARSFFRQGLLLERGMHLSNHKDQCRNENERSFTRRSNTEHGKQGRLNDALSKDVSSRLLRSKYLSSS